MKLPTVDRRTLLVGGGAGIGLVVAWLAWPRSEGSPLKARPDERLFGAYLRIGGDGRVSVAVPQAEVGQGIWTGLAQAAADELGAAWEQVAVEPAPVAEAYVNSLLGGETRLTALSTSIRAFEGPMREAAATARAMLCAEAADRWRVSAEECDSEGGQVVHEGRRIGFGELVEGAAGRAPPKRPRPRTLGSGKLAGQSLPRLDAPPKTDGSTVFTSDVRLPRMIFASARLAPPGGSIGFGNRAAAKQQPGLIGWGEGDGWVAALGETWWAAERALQAAAPPIQGTDGGLVDELLSTAFEGGDVRTVAEAGDYAAATAETRPFGATYSIAAVTRASLEPAAVVARVTDERVEIWAPTRAPDLVRSSVAMAVGAAPDEVTVYPMPIGDGSGSGFELDLVPIAVALARQAKQPVSLQLSPDIALHHAPVRPPVLAKLAALPSPDGTLTSWSARIASTAGYEAGLGGDAPLFAARGWRPPYAVPNLRIQAIDAALPIRRGYYRGGEEAVAAFAVESFIDELARKLGAEPLAFRMGTLGGNPRLAGALNAATTVAGWDGGGRGSSMGLACASLFDSHIALVVEAGIGPDQSIRVAKMTAAVDCGRAVNPALVRQQVEGGLLHGLAAALLPAPEFRGGLARATTIAGKPFERLGGVPAVTVEVVPSTAAPGGVSGLGMAVLAPAVANAIAAATGKRLRKLPFDPMGEG
jgi:isoquinoline 1-oxidoreductase beta subunit